MSADKPTIGTLSIQVAQVITTLDDTKLRLFGGEGQKGIIEYLVETDKSNAAALSSLKDLVMAQKASNDLAMQTMKSDTDKAIEEVKTKAKVKHAYLAGYAGGGGAVAAGVLKLIMFFKSGHF